MPRQSYDRTDITTDQAGQPIMTVLDMFVEP